MAQLNLAVAIARGEVDQGTTTALVTAAHGFLTLERLHPLHYCRPDAIKGGAALSPSFGLGRLLPDLPATVHLDRLPLNRQANKAEWGRRGDVFISPSVQREQIEAWTSSNGALLGEVFEELDESGGRADRPLLMEAIERVESGESDGMVVAKLDRFGRSLLDGLGAALSLA